MKYLVCNVCEDDIPTEHIPTDVVAIVICPKCQTKHKLLPTKQVLTEVPRKLGLLDRIFSVFKRNK
jgi:hypothetical protein